jgi:hypothetical protein
MLKQRTTARDKKKRTRRVDPVQVRIELLKRGMSIRQWARIHGFYHNSVWQAITHGRRGLVSDAVIASLRRDLGVSIGKQND